MKRQKKNPHSLALAVSGVETGNADVDRLLAIPIKRGVFNGISGNGREQLRLRECGMGRLEHRVDHGINEEDLKSLQTLCSYFACPLCKATI